MRADVACATMSHLDPDCKNQLSLDQWLHTWMFTCRWTGYGPSRRKIAESLLTTRWADEWTANELETVITRRVVTVAAEDRSQSAMSCPGLREGLPRKHLNTLKGSIPHA